MKQLFFMFIFLSSLGFATVSYAKSTPKTDHPLKIDDQNGIYKDSLFWFKWEGDLSSKTKLKITSKVQNLSSARPSVKISQIKSTYKFEATWPRQYNGSIITVDKNTYVGTKNGKKLYLKRGKYTIRSGKLNVPLSVR
ncbi:MAG: hypothetical protein AAFO07_29815 [Bacteroidota bacterium]